MYPIKENNDNDDNDDNNDTSTFKNVGSKLKSKLMNWLNK